MTPAAAADLRRYNTATAHLEPPFAVLDLAAMRANAESMARRAAGKPIRVASKSVRCREVISRVLAMDGFRGIMAYTLPEALWLAGSRSSDDILVAYPTADSGALGRLAGDAAAAAAITVMVDCPEHLDLIEGSASTSTPPTSPSAGGSGSAHAGPRSALRPMRPPWPGTSPAGPDSGWPA